MVEFLGVALVESDVLHVVREVCGVDGFGYVEVLYYHEDTALGEVLVEGRSDVSENFKREVRGPGLVHQGLVLKPILVRTWRFTGNCQKLARNLSDRRRIYPPGCR